MNGTLDIVRDFKTSMTSRIQIPGVSACLRPVQVSLSDAKKMAKWRTSNFQAFLTWLKPNENEVLKWLEQYSMRDNDIIFIIEMAEGDLAGQLSLYNIDFSISQAEFGRTIRDDDNRFKGIMMSASKSLLDWGFNYLHLKMIFLEVFSDNYPAISLYKKIGFRIVDEIPVRKQESLDGIVKWLRLKPTIYSKDEMFSDGRQLFKMILSKSEFSR